MTENTSEDFLRSEGKFIQQGIRHANARADRGSLLIGFATAEARDIVVLGVPRKMLIGPGDDVRSILKRLGIQPADGEEFELRSTNGVPVFLLNAQLELVKVN